MLAPPIAPMLAKLSTGLPEGEGWLFEPKWDGFRAIVFRDGDEVLIQSRDLKPLDRYFPELHAPILASFPEQSADSWRLFLTGSGAGPLVEPTGGRFVQEVNAVSLAVEHNIPTCSA